LESDEIKTAASGGIMVPNGNETHQVPLYLGCRLAYLGTITLNACVVRLMAAINL
jgi:hypothetical protein